MKHKNHLFNRKFWADELKRICFSVRRGDKVVFTKHFHDSLLDRNLGKRDVMSIFKNGTAEIIQGHDVGTYPLADGKLNHDQLRVIFGKTDSGKVIHVVVALKNPLVFVTVYFPDPAFFEPDMKTLKSEFRFKEIY